LIEVKYPSVKLLFLFLDGVGLGLDDPGINPLSRAEMANLAGLLGGRRLAAVSAPLETARASLVALDAGLGVEGLPQSATGQATLLTGRNVPGELGYHYGPKPDPAVAEILRTGNLFSTVARAGGRAVFLNAYPPTYFAAIESGHRLYSAVPLAVTSAGLPLRTMEDLHAGRAISADFTGQGWRDRLGLTATPLLTLEGAGARLAALARDSDFSFFEYWPSDHAGHGQDMPAACELLETFDRVLGGLLAAWDDNDGLILVTSDHGNMEDLSVRGHTANPVPLLVIGSVAARHSFVDGASDLTHVAPQILQTLGIAKDEWDGQLSVSFPRLSDQG
jgi:2,3-bisphosphoglycerate-independent phosphoglycerate mutase